MILLRPIRYKCCATAGARRSVTRVRPPSFRGRWASPIAPPSSMLANTPLAPPSPMLASKFSMDGFPSSPVRTGPSYVPSPVPSSLSSSQHRGDSSDLIADLFCSHLLLQIAISWHRYHHPKVSKIVLALHLYPVRIKQAGD